MSLKFGDRLLSTLLKWAFVAFSVLYIVACRQSDLMSEPKMVRAHQPLSVSYTVSGSLTKKLILAINNPQNYANLSVYANNELLVDNLNISHTGEQVLNTLVHFKALGDITLTIKANGADFTINHAKFEEVADLVIPEYQDISVKAGLDKVNSIKYGGPTIADLDNDGDYDFIVNNHNQADSKLYWNNGDGTVTAHDKNLSRWYMHDLHGTAAGDYDNDGDLDLVVTQGGGNGTNPSKANFYQNNNGKLVLMTGDVGIDKGGRGRGARWSDMDLDGDLDLMLINELSLTHRKPQHFFYENLGNGSFNYKPIEGLQDVHPSRVLLTDINNDHIDDLILYGPLSVWLGKGDFTFTDVSSQIPADVAALKNIMAVADLDIDNDGDLDLYLARGKAFEGGLGEDPSVDFDPIKQEFSIKPRGFKGIDKFNFKADGAIRFHSYYFLAQGIYRDKDYPLFLGAAKTAKVLAIDEEMDIEPNMAAGWPTDISANGMYFGHIGNGQWKAALVRNGNVFWGFKFSLSGVNEVTPEFVPQNRNEADVLLRNDNGQFTNVSKQWNIQPGANSLGVTVGDFNNDSYQDIFVYRWGLINSKTSDFMLLNTGKGTFETATMHGANDIGGPGNGDMGQAFDFDLDGRLDLLNGSEGGQWYLYANDQSNLGHYALVNVGYSPVSNVDAISAEVILKTATQTYRKRVGSAGEVFSQSLLNIVHFGLGEEQQIESIQVRWRDGTSVELQDKAADQLFDTNKLDPDSLTVTPAITDIRQGTSMDFVAEIMPENADQSIQWTSSDESVLSVDDQGRVTALGNVGENARISATSAANGVSALTDVTVVDWYAQPIQSLSVVSDKTEILAGQRLPLKTSVVPTLADDKGVMWSSSQPKIASVDEDGVVTALAQGHVTITAVSQADLAISDELQLIVKPLIKPFINIVDAQLIAQSEFEVGDKITLKVNYHAGSGNKVIASDEGGIRFWFRHFKYEWIPAKDTIFVDSSALQTESGSSSMTFSLEGLTPTAELPDGHFYYLRASFTSSDGNSYDSAIYPIKVVAKKTD
ncbi:FG-GAP-like repeat-containing protein [Paraglaciecola arctica]|uniref:FG-GAP-like repeat-containing protein n=1 Tax=Paraglaciecola arctica TaxID=1128911 RepID=UPI001C06A5E8|nr:FG-GAP-like repeat-containing protein [Paraglaciecola arctica]MBU3005358.1 VCBS repeat-containing protein [Paraglaciecola arctica]